MSVTEREVMQQEVVAKEVELARKSRAVAVSNSWDKVSGKITKKGDTLNILGLEDPEIHKYTGADIEFSDVENTLDKVVITEADYVGKLLKDVDAKQTEFNPLQELSKKAGYAIAKAHDKFIYRNIVESYNSKSSQIIDAENLTSANMLSLISNAQSKLYEADVPEDEEIVMEVSPAFQSKLLLAGIINKTDNKDLFANGYFGSFGLTKIMLTNNLYKEDGFENIILRTKKSYAFAQTVKNIETVRAENNFGTKLKGLTLYGGKVIRPKEIVIIKFKPAAETII